MNQLILGAIALVAVLWLLRGYTKASPSAMARLMRKLAGYAAMLVAALLLVRGRFDAAIPLFVFGAGLAGWMPGLPALFGGGGRPSRGRVSAVRSRFLQMELDHDSGTLRGDVLAGRFAGRRLDDLGPNELGALYREALSDPESRSLLEAYLDRRAPGWREHFEQDAAAGPGEGARRSSNAMTKEEAHQILGVEPGAGAEEIRRAHRALMKKLHPDQGGSTYLAARVNEARDVLLGSHR
ncbi:DnaJ domain-containing protein [Labrys wisconsinensis]|uniref:J domain-containing protein n=1 Tax=Labrys wisconsinensis TaxID=425677 RepID=A0ABU0J260_9HYPH|nr:DnaJ domain-containing protein [Labrys wisconsinensis]MDQ0468319.1 hypothetical protein [Labrys wisconsinensis]